MNRRKFLSLLGATGVASAVIPAVGAATPAKDFSGNPDAVGVLHDSVRCIGCRKCEESCQTVNDLPKPVVAFDDLTVLDKKRRTDFTTYTVVNKYTTSEGKAVFRKQQCNHCQEPACASACFVKAFTKTPEGPVVYNPDVCVGCRYCMVACPYYIPTYDYNNAWNPLIYKCTMCSGRIAEGKLPGCVEGCPQGALTFGKRSELMKIARQRILENPDLYHDAVYGENEMGGTNWLYLSPVSHEELDQPVLGKTSAPELTSGALGAVAMVAGVWPVLLGGAYAISKRRMKNAAAEQETAVNRAVQKTRKEADLIMQKALAKAEKDKESSIAKEVKQAREAAIKEIEDTIAAEGSQTQLEVIPENMQQSAKEQTSLQNAPLNDTKKGE